MDFHVHINCVVISTDIQNNKQYVLSNSTDEVIFPSFELTSDNLQNVNKTLVDFVRSKAFVHELECIPQLISLHGKSITTADNQLNIVYGFLVSKTNSLNDCYWKEFSLIDLDPAIKHYDILLEVIQKLK